MPTLVAGAAEGTERGSWSLKLDEEAEPTSPRLGLDCDEKEEDEAPKEKLDMDAAWEEGTDVVPFPADAAERAPREGVEEEEEEGGWLEVLLWKVTLGEVGGGLFGDEEPFGDVEFPPR